MNLHIYSNTYSDSDSSSESDLEEEFCENRQRWFENELEK